MSAVVLPEDLDAARALVEEWQTARQHPEKRAGAEGFLVGLIAAALADARPAGRAWAEYACVEADWTLEADGPPLWGWGTLEEARMLLVTLPDGWQIVERDVTVSAPRSSAVPAS